MIHEVEYWFDQNNRRRTAGFNDVTGEITSPKQWFEQDPLQPTKGIGEVVEVIGGFAIRVNGEYPYFVVDDNEGGGGNPENPLGLVLIITDVEVLVQDTGSGATVKINIEGEPYINVPEFRIANGSYDSGWKSTWWGDTDPDIFANVPAGTYTAYVRDVEFPVVNDLEEFNLQQTAVALTAQAVSTNETAAANNDGTFRVNILTGSGEYEIEWWDAATTGLSGSPANTAIRTMIPAGTYGATVTDVLTGQTVELEVIITQPASPPQVFNGSFLFVPSLNSITFVVDPIQSADNETTFQQFDNILFKDRLRLPGYACENYYQKIVKSDRPKVQFYSDFGLHDIQLYNYFTDEVVASYPISLKETNIGATVSHAIRIEAHTDPGKSRVYFQAGALQVPITVGQTFQITNNADGFDGSYTVAEVQYDTAIGYQYLVINKNYGILDSFSNAVGRFVKDIAQFNVYESQPWFTMLEDGIYYFRIRAYNTGSPVVKYAYSEPIDVRVNHPFTMLIEYRNIDNAFDTTWTTGFQGFVRVEGVFYKRLPGGESTVVRNSDFSITKTSAKKTRSFMIEVVKLPPYLHEKLDCIKDCDIWFTNKMPCQTSEAWSDPAYVASAELANRTLKVETPWFSKYNSNDLGTIVDGGFLAHESGLLKL